MSLSTLSAKQGRMNKHTDYFVYGYIRMIDIDDHQIIPMEIVNILIKFYYSNSRIIYIAEHPNSLKEPPTICVAEIDIDKNKNYQFKIKLLDESIKNMRYKASANCGICCAGDISLPQYIIKNSNYHLQKTKQYDVVFVVQKDRDECGAYIINPSMIENSMNDIYYWKLP